MISRIVPPPPVGFSCWEAVMELALAQAAQAALLHEVPVGAVVVDALGRVVGLGHNVSIEQQDPTAHAEIQAIRMACKTLGNYRLDDCFLVVTLEPCLMCVGAIVHARIAGVVYGAGDAKAGAVASCLDGFDMPFHNHRPWHMGRILAQECQQQLQDFFASKR